MGREYSEYPTKQRRSPLASRKDERKRGDKDITNLPYLLLSSSYFVVAPDGSFRG